MIKEPFAIEDVECTDETPDAICIEKEGDEPFWVPRSVVHEDSEVLNVGDEGTLLVDHWFAAKNGWI